MEPRTREEDWRGAWDVVVHQREFLRRLAAVYRSRAAEDGVEDAEDLLHEFIIRRLPRLVRILDRLPEVDRERYLITAFRNFARNHRRAARRYRNAIDSFATEQGSTESAPDQEPSEKVAQAAAALEPLVREFFTDGATAGSLRNVAQKYGISRYEARKRIVDGSLAFASQLGRTEALSPRELMVSRAVLLHGVPISEVARSTGLTDAQVRRALATSRAAIGRFLSR